MKDQTAAEAVGYVGIPEWVFEALPGGAVDTLRVFLTLRYAEYQAQRRGVSLSLAELADKAGLHEIPCRLALLWLESYAMVASTVQGEFYLRAHIPTPPSAADG